jgi:hypothetical protein
LVPPEACEQASVDAGHLQWGRHATGRPLSHASV